jgi:metallo-beta-lactamase family protein
MAWAKAVSDVKKYFVVHGDAPSADSLAQRIREELGGDSYAPYSGAEFDLISGKITVDAQPKPIAKKKTSGGNISPTYSDLVSAADRLSRLIKISDGRANADMRKLTEAINHLCDDWEI